MEGFEAATYGDRFADVYDDWYPATNDTATCIERLAELAGARPGTAVLELAVGTGRLALPLAARGLDVRGIDASAAMLARLAAKQGADRVATALGDIADPILPARPDDPTTGVSVGLVFVADNTLFAVPGADARAHAFATIAALLRPSHGCFVFDAFLPPDDDADATTDSAVTIRDLTADRVVLSAATRDREARTITGQFIDLTEGHVRLRPYHLHYASPAELDAELAVHGLHLTERLERWDGAPFTPASTHHVSVYTAA